MTDSASSRNILEHAVIDFPSHYALGSSFGDIARQYLYGLSDEALELALTQLSTDIYNGRYQAYFWLEYLRRFFNKHSSSNDLPVATRRNFKVDFLISDETGTLETFTEFNLTVAEAAIFLSPLNDAEVRVLATNATPLVSPEMIEEVIARRSEHDTTGAYVRHEQMVNNAMVWAQISIIGAERQPDSSWLLADLNVIDAAEESDTYRRDLERYVAIVNAAIASSQEDRFSDRVARLSDPQIDSLCHSVARHIYLNPASTITVIDDIMSVELTTLERHAGLPETPDIEGPAPQPSPADADTTGQLGNAIIGATFDSDEPTEVTVQALQSVLDATENRRAELQVEMDQLGEHDTAAVRSTLEAAGLSWNGLSKALEQSYTSFRNRHDPEFRARQLKSNRRSERYMRDDARQFREQGEPADED